MRRAKHALEWRQAAPLWSVRPAGELDRGRAMQPTLLRFTDERFMEDVRGELERDPGLLRDREVPLLERWQDALAPRPPANDDRTAEPARLYQPIHGRFYLVAGTLVCRTLGLPDRQVDLAAGERVSFVMRRLITAPDGRVEEYAWTIAGGEGTWTPADPLRVADGEGRVEQRQPLFPMRYLDGGRARVIHAGLVPVASRETLQAGRLFSSIADGPDPLADVRKATFRVRVHNALANLRSQFTSVPAATGIDEAREALLFVLIDLAALLRDELPDVWRALQPGAQSPFPEAAQELMSRTFFGGRTWAAAVLEAAALEEPITRGDLDGATNAITGSLTKAQMQSIVASYMTGTSAAPDEFDRTNLGRRIVAALDAVPASATPPLGLVTPKLDPSGGALYAIRLLYERPQCAAIHPPLLSARTRAFQLASYFDPEAPARPVVINLPVDTSISGLRRFPRAVSFVISNKLRQQIQRVRDRKLADLDEGSLGPGGAIDLGMVCSLSIPIITIVAMLLLMIIVSLLNIVFWWLPFLFVCLPLKLESK